MTTIPAADRTIVVSEKTYLKLEDMAAERRKEFTNPLQKVMITPKSLAQHLLAVAVEANGRRRG